MTDQTGVLPWWGEQWHKPAFLLFLLCWSVAMVSCLVSPAAAHHWPQILLLITAMVTTLVTLGRQLPFQNVVLIALVIGATSVLWTLLVQHSFDASAAVLWTVIILNSRGVAQFLMRRYREARFYGWAIFGIGAVIPAAFAWILYNQWPQIISAPVMTLLVLLITFPLFMNKRPVEPPVSLQPLFVTIALLAWLVIHSPV